MLNPQTLREASFSLATSGWSPDAVDAYLADLADRLEAGTVDWMLERTRLTDREYRVESPGYVENKVRAFFAQVLESVEAAVDSPLPSSVEEAVRADEHVDEAVDAPKAAVLLQIDAIGHPRHRVMRSHHRFDRHTHPGAAASLREGMTETLTVTRLGINGSLKRTLESTNPCESMIECVRRTSRNV